MSRNQLVARTPAEEFIPRLDTTTVATAAALSMNIFCIEVSIGRLLRMDQINRNGVCEQQCAAKTVMNNIIRIENDRLFSPFSTLLWNKQG